MKKSAAQLAVGRRPGEPSGKKKALFWAILLSLPVLAFLILEGVLRIFNYGGSLDLVVRTMVNGKEYYTLNREVGRRYFSQEGIAIPEAFDDLFEITKRPGTLRIFMLGESTMAGFPFDYNATAPRLLQDRLQATFPDRRIEVVNVGLAAVNSYAVLDLIDELIPYEPDAFIVYLGHNEFYGAFGIGSTEYLGKWRGLVNFYLSLEDYRTFLLLRDAISAISRMFGKPATPEDASLMASMVREKSILYGSEDYRTARENFEANFRAIVRVAHDAGVPIVISTLTSNIRDQAPLLGSFCPQKGMHEVERWKDQIAAGKEFMGQRRYAGAAEAFQLAIALDSCHAEGYFLLGVAHDSLRKYDEAYESYRLARDFDALRFRASDDFNLLIRKIGAETGTPVADVEEAFEAASAHRLVGRNLMLEHLHPNFDGYFLLAKTFFLALRENSLLVSRDVWQSATDRTDEYYRGISGVTEFTLETANIRTFSLVHGWPFVPGNAVRPVFPARNKVQEIALHYTNKKMPWSSAHMRLAEWYRDNGEYEKAYAEYFALSKVAWYSYQPLMHMGDLARMMNRPAAAESLYLKAQGIQETPFVNIRTGMLYFELKRFSEAISRFEATVAAPADAREALSIKELSLARYFLGAAYGKQGDIRKARTNLELAVGLDSTNMDARTMLAQIQTSFR